MSANPILVEVTRGGVVESFHRGATAVIDASGGAVFSLGDVARPVFPRSAVKAIQALPLIESGAADKFGLSDEALALCCSSHGGEPRHVALASEILGKAGLAADALACGAHWPLHEESARALARAGRAPSALHNNCSGKHAGFLCLACAMGEPPQGYTRAGHAAQRAVRAALEDVLAISLDGVPVGADGCDIPAYAMPLKALAHGFARMATGQGLAPQRAAAAKRLMSAAIAHPFFVGGEGRYDSSLMAALPGVVFAKTGAEGVYCGALPALGLGLAVKIDDGASRAAEIAFGALVARFSGLDPAALAPFTVRTLRNWNGADVGAIRPAVALAG